MKRKSRPNTGPTLSSSLKRLRGYCSKIERETKKLPLNLGGNGGQRTKMEIARDTELVNRCIRFIRKTSFYSSMVEQEIKEILKQYNVNLNNNQKGG